MDPARLHEAHAVIFHIPTAPDIRQIAKRPGQLWVALCMESEANVPDLVKLKFIRYFDLTMTYRLDSDIPAVYFGTPTATAMTAPPKPKTADAPVVCFVSNPDDKWGRVSYIRELMRYLPVHSYGKCLKNRTLHDDSGQAAKSGVIARYKFTLAFENSRARDYVTEKFFEPLMAGSVPVYLGAPNVQDFAPADRCFIDASRFRGPQELAEYLAYLDQNDDEYQSYLEWKSRPLSQRFIDLADRLTFDRLERLCECVKVRNGEGELARFQNDPIHKALKWWQEAHPSPSVT
jgi:hypothetical protein